MEKATTIIRSQLEELKAELNDWRSQQIGRKHIPKQYWNRAYELLKHYPLDVVSKELRLEYAKLKKHLPQISQAASHGNKPSKAFLELKASDLSQRVTNSNSLQAILQQSEQTCRMVFERKDGNKLTLELPLGSAKIDDLYNSFIRG